MNAPLYPSYTNEVSPEFLRRLDDSPFTEEQLAGFDDEVMEIIRQQRAYAENIPLARFTESQPRAVKPVTVG